MKRIFHHLSGFRAKSLSACCALLLLIMPAWQTHGQDQLAEQLDQSITKFYQTGNLVKVFEAIENSVQAERVTKAINFEILVLFFAEVFRHSPETIPLVTQHFSKYRNDLNVLPWMAAWLSNSAEGAAAVASLKSAGYEQVHDLITAQPPTDIRSFSPRSAALIDALWVYFYAAGRLEDLSLIYQMALFDEKDQSGVPLLASSDERKQLRDYATGSLVVHAALHKNVLGFLGRAEVNAPDEAKVHVQSMIASALHLKQQMQSEGKSLDKALGFGN